MITWKKFVVKIKNLDKKKKFILIAIAFITLVMLWAFLSASFITAKVNKNNIKNTPDNQKVDAVGIIITETKDRNKYFEIYGENGNYNNDENVATLNHVVGNFYSDNEVSMSFQSSKGSYDEKTGIIRLYENTYIVLKNGTSLSADKLTWYGSGKETIAEGNIKIKKSNEMYATADKCIIGADYDKFKITGKTRTNVYTNKENK